jgi:hypothetical protein
MHGSNLLHNGSSPKHNAPIKGAGIARRRDDVHARAELATDAILGVRRFLPSCTQAQREFNVPATVLRQHLRARRELDNGGIGNGSHGSNGTATAKATPEHSTPRVTAPDPGRLVRDQQLGDLISALDQTIGVLADLRNGRRD